MKKQIATVITNCEEDSLRRVKVKAPGVWNESPLMMSVGQIYLDKGDRVLVDISEYPVIVGKIFDKTQVDKSQQGDGVVIWESGKGDEWVQIRGNTEGVILKTSSDVIIELKGNILKIVCKEVSLQSDTIQLEGQVTLENGIGTPDGTGCLCALPECLLTGAPHTSKSTAPNTI